ncbi:hypothetical protein LCGC14_1015940 [marine sediment metagenome]|uniref:Uncharacterized protein n=1 Tax=marine sediment metagenome TaxID=412755 RepID=A0A0F9MYS5_9ZZZZ
MTKKLIGTLDDALRPMTMECLNCGGELTVYPCPIPTGTGFCPTCSPNWLESFAKFMMNEERVRRGYAKI